MNAQEREILKSLIQIVWADGTVDDRDREILGQLLAELDLSRKDIHEVGGMMVEATDMPDLEVILAKGKEEKSDLMKLMLAVAMTKGHLNPPELRYVQAIAHKLAIDKDGLDKLIAEVRKLPGQR